MGDALTNEKTQENYQQKKDELTIECLPYEHINKIAGYLPTVTVRQWSLTNKRYNQFLKEKLLERKEQMLESKAPLFILHVVHGEQENVEAMLKQNPELLLKTGTVIDYSGHTIQGTAYQIALGAEDIDMCNMLDKYFAMLNDANGNLIGEVGKKKQFKAQFPDGIIENKPSEYDFNALVAIITNDQMINEQPNAETEIALQAFRDEFTPNANNIITTGKHFNMQHLIKAFVIYNENYNDWSHDQGSLFWRQVIGYLQRLVPACYAQAFCLGVYYVVEEQEPVKRNFKLVSRPYYPLSVDSFNRLGWEFGVYSYGAPVGATNAEEAARCGAAVVKLCRAKTADLVKIKTNLYSNNEQLLPNRDSQPQIVRRSRWCQIL